MKVDIGDEKRASIFCRFDVFHQVQKGRLSDLRAKLTLL